MILLKAMTIGRLYMIIFVKMIQCQLAQNSAVLPPRQGGGALRVRIVVPYLVNADTLFMGMDSKVFHLKVDDTEYSACLDADSRAPFKIMPGDSATMEIALEVYSESMDAIYNGKNFYIILQSEL